MNQNITTNLLSYSIEPEKKQPLANAICDKITSSIFNENTLDKLDGLNFFTKMAKIKQLQEDCSSQISELHEDFEFSINLLSIMKQVQQILSLIIANDDLKAYFQEKLMGVIRMKVGIFVP